MGTFFESKFIKNLQEGELPVIKIELQNKTIISIAIAFLLASLIIMLISYMFKQA